MPREFSPSLFLPKRKPLRVRVSIIAALTTLTDIPENSAKPHISAMVSANTAFFEGTSF